MEQDTADAAGRAVARAQAAMAVVRSGMHEVYAAVADLESEGVAGRAGYRSTANLLGDALRVDAAEAKRLVDRAGRLMPGVALSGEPLAPELPAAAAASAAGVVSEGHLSVIGSTMRHLASVPGLDAQVLAEAEASLVGHAATLAPRGLAKAALRLVETLDPDGTAPVEEPEPSDEAHVVRRRDGSLAMTVRIHGAADAELIVEVLDALAAPAGADDTRTRPQRNAEAVKELCGLAASPTGVAADARRGHDGCGGAGADPADDAGTADGCTRVTVAGRALLAVTIDHRWLQARVGHGLLDSERALDPATARRLACDAGIVPMVLGSRGEPLDVGRLSYTVPEGMRRALHVRDGGCSFPGCTRRPRRCHAHHVRHWGDGGPTCLENLTLLCSHHHQLVHHEQWTITMVDGRPWYTPPRFVDPAQRPRPGGRFPLPDPVGTAGR